MTLYKFLKANRAIDVLESGKIRFAQLSSLNDPFESIPKLDSYITRDLLMQMLNTLMSDHSLVENVIEDSIKTTYENLNPYQKLLFSKKFFASMLRQYMANEFKRLDTNFNDYFLNAIKKNMDSTITRMRQRVTTFISDVVCILSLSAARTNVLMWSHYADSHRGIAIGFDLNNPFFAKAIPIIYRSERPVIDFSKTPTSEIEKQAFAQKFLAVKNNSWQYEEEYRLLNPSISMELLKQNDINGFPIYVSPFPSESIMEVIFGCKTKENDEISIRAILSSKYPQATIYKAGLSSDGFQLSVSKC